MADKIADTLGELKGAVMKVGQIASQTQDFLPKEFSQALEKLQKEAPPMPFEVILEQVESELGKPVGELFEYLQENTLRLCLHRPGTPRPPARRHGCDRERCNTPAWMSPATPTSNSYAGPEARRPAENAQGDG